jgi:hypothetical protein
MKKRSRKSADELRPEYDFPNMPGGVKGKYAQRYRHGTNLALLDVDTAKAFPDDRAVNEALRVVMNAAARLRYNPARDQRRKTDRSR